MKSQKTFILSSWKSILKKYKWNRIVLEKPAAADTGPNLLRAFVFNSTPFKKISRTRRALSPHEEKLHFRVYMRHKKIVRQNFSFCIEAILIRRSSRCAPLWYLVRRGIPKIISVALPGGFSKCSGERERERIGRRWSLLAMCAFWVRRKKVSKF